ncbi:unnamed protein product [Oppiella nova]|uniref:Uncharacterized protein n=1 Tax=Oppiella nova TaxID=334625 RepID=A0A7R9M352_9ACAR|nr:unnamed protein product [Oppiella nova]CAG2169873.1 unnamed protein product [Oppiella nova]
MYFPIGWIDRNVANRRSLTEQYSPLRLSPESATNIYWTSIAIYSAGLVINIFYPYNIIDSEPVFHGMPMGGQYLHVSVLLSHSGRRPERLLCGGPSLML